jgi:hypothetical protein
MGLHRYNPFEGAEHETAEEADPVARALGYPFEQKENSFLFSHGGMADLDEEKIAHGVAHAADDEDWFDGVAAGTGLSAEDVSERIAVIAAGSNSSPRQLRRKFRGMAHDEPVPVLRARLHDYAVVYAALISSYGAVPATNHHVPGAAADVFLTLLTRDQFRRMNLTEDVGNAYALASLRRGSVRLAGVPVPGLVYGYFGLPGAMKDEKGGLIGLSHVGPQEGVKAADQLGAQRICAKLTACQVDPLPVLRRDSDGADPRPETTRIIQERFSVPPWV